MGSALRGCVETAHCSLTLSGVVTVGWRMHENCHEEMLHAEQDIMYDKCEKCTMMVVLA